MHSVVMLYFSFTCIAIIRWLLFLPGRIKAYLLPTFIVFSFGKMVTLTCILVFFYTGVSNPLMLHCSRDQPQPVHLHRQIHSRVLPSTWPHENNPCFDPRIYIFWKGGSKSARGSRDGDSRSWNGMVWKCIIQAWRKRETELFNV